MVQYDTHTSKLTLHETVYRQGKVWKDDGVVLDLQPYSEEIRQVVIQVAKLSISLVNGNNPTAKQGPSSVSQLDKLKKVLERTIPKDDRKADSATAEGAAKDTNVTEAGISV